MDAHLREIIDRGGRAQSAEAARLLIRLESDPEDAEARSMARAGTGSGGTGVDLEAQGRPPAGRGQLREALDQDAPVGLDDPL
jgi:hypothetical protein